ncbi:MAG TPA: phosphoribosylaminoimidazolesuccinocarboxamide synthase [Streptosporangiaceae bacterium]
MTTGYRHVYSGKVRDLYRTDDGLLLLVASDRISAYDYVLDTPIPDKGRILTRLSLWWFERLADLVPNHLVSADVPEEFAGRGVLVRPLEMVPVECVARGYLTGSGLIDYRRTQSVCGVPLPPGLDEASRLDEPIFTPTTKASVGDHDAPMTFADVVAEVGAATAEELRRITIEVYRRGADLARERGIIVADTKVEFGRTDDGTLVLADELLTPDSSRFWPADDWAPGRPQRSFDKQYVRDWLTSPASGWDRGSGTPPPPLPEEIVARTRETYIAAYERITGRTWA